MNRRTLVIALGTGAVTAGLVGSANLPEIRDQPLRDPFLTDAHLRAVAEADLPRQRVHFVGNSLTLGHDVPGRVARHAARDGMSLATAIAAANGARLVETWRIDAFRRLLQPAYWDAVVLQDFTETALRRADSWASAYAIRRMASTLAPTPIVLYPPFPAGPYNRIYRTSGWSDPAPDDPSDYARRTIAHYSELAERPGITRAPIPERWLAENNTAYYAEDNHHASASGAEFVARILWGTIREALSAIVDD